MKIRTSLLAAAAWESGPADGVVRESAGLIPQGLEAVNSQSFNFSNVYESIKLRAKFKATLA